MSERRVKYDDKGNAFIWCRMVTTWSGIPICEYAGWIPEKKHIPKEKWPDWAGYKKVNRVIPKFCR